MSHSAQCLCGEIKYEFQNEPTVAGICHCKNCQRQAGSAFCTLAGVPTAEFEITGEPKLYQESNTTSGATVERYFCGNCGSPIYSAIPSQPDSVFLKTGTLDHTSGFKPSFHAWCSTKQNWVDIDDDIPQMQSQ
jgi:hypothetical protein